MFDCVHWDNCMKMELLQVAVQHPAEYGIEVGKFMIYRLNGLGQTMKMTSSVKMKVLFLL